MLDGEREPHEITNGSDVHCEKSRRDVCAQIHQRHTGVGIIELLARLIKVKLPAGKEGNDDNTASAFHYRIIMNEYLKKLRIKNS